MLSQAENELLTRTGSGTPMGEVMRRYWQPAALSEELQAGGPPREILLLGEPLVAYRGDDGTIGLLGRHCPHRAADLSYARIEDGGLRCAYHGWLFDAAGACLDQPAEPRGKSFAEKIHHTAYPCQEAAGIVWAYLGPGAPPPLPRWDWLLAPTEHVFAFKGYQECNWLQANEGEIDPSHLSFLHRTFEDKVDEDAYGMQLLEATEGSDLPVMRILREQTAPEIEIEQTDFGVRLYTMRDLPGARRHLRVTNFLFPNAAVVAVAADWGVVQIHVPVDDEHNWRYDIVYSYCQPMDRAGLRREKMDLYPTSDYRPRRNKANRYGFDLAEQKSKTYIGVGLDINVHDTWAVEGAGVIQDRTTEHLGTQDKAIIAARRMLLNAVRSVQAGGDLPLLGPDAEAAYRDLGTIDLVVPADQWRTAWRERGRQRLADSPWASSLLAAEVG